MMGREDRGWKTKRGKTLDSDSWIMCPGEEMTGKEKFRPGSCVDGSVSPLWKGIRNGYLCHFLFEFLTSLGCRLSIETHSSVHTLRSGKLDVCMGKEVERKKSYLSWNSFHCQSATSKPDGAQDHRKVRTPIAAYGIARPSRKSIITGLVIRSLDLFVEMCLPICMLSNKSSTPVYVCLEGIRKTGFVWHRLFLLFYPFRPWPNICWWIL